MPRPKIGVSGLREAAKLAGGAVEKDSGGGRWTVYQICAPDGLRWVSGYTTQLRVEWLTGQRVWRDNAIQEAIERMEQGTQPDEGE